MSIVTLLLAYRCDRSLGSSEWIVQVNGLTQHGKQVFKKNFPNFSEEGKCDLATKLGDYNDEIPPMQLSTKYLKVIGELGYNVMACTSATIHPGHINSILWTLQLFAKKPVQNSLQVP